MEQRYDLSRFEQAHRGSGQSFFCSGYDAALREVRAGRKESHWMWYIFPILRGLSRSRISQMYALSGPCEAEAFLRDPYLGGNLIEISRALLLLDATDPRAVFGRPDDWKLHSCMTLFSSVSREEPVFDRVLEQYFRGKRHGRTLDRLNQLSNPSNQ